MIRTKFSLLLVIGFLFTEKAIGQTGTDRKAIEQTFLDYRIATNNGNIEQEVEYIYPGLFNHIPKDSLIYMLKLYRSDTRINIKNDSVINVAGIHEIDGIKYALIEYRQKMIMDFYEIRDEGGASLAISVAYAQLKDEFGEEFITLDPDNYTITIALPDEMYGILDPAFTGWKFLYKNDDMLPILEQIIPAEILELYHTKIFDYDLFCFYKMDEKYSRDTNRLEIGKWLDTKLSEIENGEISGNILEQNNGGPNGANWNLWTDLYLVITTPQIIDIQQLEIILNGKPYRGSMISKKSSPNNMGTIFWLVLKQDFWENNMRKINETDYEGLYGKELLRKIDEEGYTPIAPLDTGEIMEIKVRIGKQEIKKYFHAAYGE